jgi:hypothetical protein
MVSMTYTTFVILLGSTLGGLFGLLCALGQVKLVRLYAKDKPPEIQQRAYDTVDQLKLTSFFGLPLIFAIVGYMLAVAFIEQGS